jgi:hypothetical protein
MAIYDLYGSQAADLEEARDVLEAALGIRFEARESSYQGGDYFRWGENEAEHLILKRNVDPFDDEPVEESFSQYPILFYVNDTLRSTEVQEQIAQKAPSFALLQHEEV